jgi:hypothetical protein
MLECLVDGLFFDRVDRGKRRLHLAARVDGGDLMYRLSHTGLDGSFEVRSGLDLLDLLYLRVRKLRVLDYHLLDLGLGLFDGSAVPELAGGDGVKPVGRGCFGRLVLGRFRGLNFYRGLQFGGNAELITLCRLFDDRCGCCYRKRFSRSCLLAASVA